MYLGERVINEIVSPERSYEKGLSFAVAYYRVDRDAFSSGLGPAFSTALSIAREKGFDPEFFASPERSVLLLAISDSLNSATPEEKTGLLATLKEVDFGLVDKKYQSFGSSHRPTPDETRRTEQRYQERKGEVNTFVIEHNMRDLTFSCGATISR